MIVSRDLLDEIKPFLKRREFISIIGPRQSGKTTFLEILKNYLKKSQNVKGDLIYIVTFEDRKLLRQFESDPVSFVRSYAVGKSNETTYLMIDEFQYVEKGGQKLKLVYDTIKNVKVILTGSSSLEIKAQVGKYLVGRILSFHLYPFNFGEYLRAKSARLEKIYQETHKKILKWLFEHKSIKHKERIDVFFEEMIDYFEQFCIWGGYPAVVLSKTDKERYKVLGDIYNNYLLKDIKGLLELATERNLSLLSQYIATQIGNIVVYQNLGQASSLDYRQLKRHLTILKETFVCNEINPYFRNKQKELVKNPKIFFTDIGFRNYLIENINTLDKRADSGAIAENIIFNQLNRMGETGNKINFWRTKSGAEVDFILHKAGEIIPIEVKFAKFNHPKISRGFISFIDFFKPKRGLILTKNYWGKIKKNNTEILLVPIYYL
jgi:predicted AAA+ superfamily ATPase